MQMNDQALQGIMNIQTQMLQNITRLQQEEMTTRNQTFTPPQSNVQSNSGGSSSFTSSMPAGGMSVQDPTQYSTYAAPYSDRGRQFSNAAGFLSRGAIGGTIAEMRSFNPSQHSPEATEQYMTQQAGTIQQGAVNTLAGFLNGGANVGGFFVPGLVAGTVAGLGAGAIVAAGTHQMVQGAQSSLHYQHQLQNDSYRFINAFESTDTMGGIGFNLSDEQSISKYLRHLAPQKFLSDNQMSKILDGASNNNLLQTVSDAKSFQKQFSDIVDAVKQITVTMNQSIDQATKFMGEMQQRGIMSKDMPFVAAQSKVLASMLGVSANQGAQMMLQATDNVTSGTNLDPTKISQSAAHNMYYAQNLQEQSMSNDPQLYHYIMNNGGAASVGSNFEQMGRQYANSQQGSSQLLGMYASAFKYDNATGEFKVDSNKMNDLLNNQYSVDQMQSMSQNYINTLSTDQKVKLQGTIGDTFNQYASSQQTAKLMKENAQNYMDRAAQSGQKIDMQTALIESGSASNYQQAQLQQAMINQATNPANQEVYTARVLKQEMDSQQVANQISLGQQASNWMRSTFGVPLGDQGQNVSDAFGRGLLNYQKFINGITDTSIAGGPKLPSFNASGLSQVANDANTINAGETSVYNLASQNRDILGTMTTDNLTTKMQKGKIDAQSINDAIKNKGNIDNFDPGLFDSYMSSAKNGTLSATDAADLHKQLNSGKLGFVDRQRVQMILNQANGNYDGFWGGVKRYGDQLDQGALDLVTKHTFFSMSKGTAIAGENSGMTLDSLKAQQTTLIDTKKKLNEQLAQLYQSGNLNMDSASLKELETAIKSGDKNKVRALTNNSQAADLANRYSSLSVSENAYSKGMSGYSEMSRYTKGIQSEGNQLINLFTASGVYDKNTANDLFGSMKTSGADILNKIKKGQISYSGMFQADKNTQAQMDAIFQELPQGDMQGLAKYLMSKDSNLKLSSLETNGQIDSKKLETQIQKILRDQNISKPDTSGKSSSSSKTDSKVVSATQDHTKAMKSVLTSLQKEVSMMHDYMNGSQITGGNQSTVGT